MEETFTDTNFMADGPVSDAFKSQSAASDLRSAAADPSNKAKQIAQEAGAKAQHFKQAATEKAQQFREFAGTKANDLKETAGVKAQQLKQAASEQVEHGRVKAKEAHADAEEYVRNHPTKSVLTALGVGIVIGLVIRR
jgi:ElaB/YqjD/DUF883 family membrane-anchored ribosome-binding protein